jgi:hypothetical protein
MVNLGEVHAMHRLHRRMVAQFAATLAAVALPPGALAVIIIDPPPEPTWTTVDSLQWARAGHGAVLLPSGRVLVIFGEGLGPLLDSAEVYDPLSRRWSAAGSLSPARTRSSCALLSTGRVLVAGGAGGTASLVLFTAGELFDPASLGWSSTSALHQGRYEANAVVLSNGRVLVAGGNVGTSSSTPTGSAELYDPRSGTWADTGHMVSAGRYRHTLTRLESGKVLALAGEGVEGAPGPFAELYDPATGMWTETGPAFFGFTQHAAALLRSGKVLFAGGFNGISVLASAALYDPATETIVPTGSLATPRAAHSLTVLPSGRVLAAGGLDTSGAIASTELYDPVSGTWSPGPAMAEARYAHSATLLPSGRVLVAGGEVATGIVIASAEEFDEGPSQPLPVPTITSAPASVAAGGAVDLAGAGFTSVPEGSRGGALSSPTNHPLVQLTPRGGGEPSYAPVGTFDDVSAAAVLPASLAAGSYDLRIVVSAVASASVPIEVLGELAVTPPRATLLIGAAQAFTASGGSGPPYTWSLAVSGSGGTIDPGTGAYTAGATSPSGGVRDVVQVADAGGHLATAEVLVVPPVSVAPAVVSLVAGSGQYFVATGGSGTGYSWSLAASASGGSIGPLNGAYVAGPTPGIDVVRATDSLGFSATAEVTVTSPPAPSAGGGGGGGCSSVAGGTSPLALLGMLALVPGIRRRAMKRHAVP